MQRPIEPELDESISFAQYRMLATYMPHMYVVHIVSGLLVGELFSNVAPPEYVFPIMTLLMFAALFRLSYWLNPRLASPESSPGIKSTVQRAPTFAAAFHATISLWILLIAPYGNESQQMLAFNANLPRCVYAILLTGCIPLIISLLFLGGETALIFAAIYAASITVQVISVGHQHSDFVDALRLKIAADAIRSDAEAARHDIARVANTDSLSGLPNRRHLLNIVAAHLADNAEQNFILGLIDLDGFKPVNDLYGHIAGDEVIYTVANRLRTAIEPHGMVARFGGDEFGFMLFDADDSATALARVAMLMSTIEMPITLAEGVVNISACCGMSRYPEMATASTQLFQRADEALYAAKHLGRGKTIMYGSELESKQTRRRLVEMRMRLAIARREFDLAFQPIRDLNSGRITSYEALTRWTDAELGPISPGEFIPIAEQSGLISSVSDILFERALEEAATWPHEVALSFNLSPLQIHNHGFPLHTLSILAKHRFPPERLYLEVTETALLSDVDHAAVVIQQLRSAGIRVALDDFGVGFAGFWLSLAPDLRQAQD